MSIFARCLCNKQSLTLSCCLSGPKFPPVFPWSLDAMGRNLIMYIFSLVLQREVEADKRDNSSIQTAKHLIIQGNCGWNRKMTIGILKSPWGMMMPAQCTRRRHCWWVFLALPTTNYTIFGASEKCLSCPWTIYNVQEEPLVYPRHAIFYTLTKYELVVVGGATKDGRFSGKTWSSLYHQGLWVKSAGSRPNLRRLTTWAFSGSSQPRRRHRKRPTLNIDPCWVFKSESQCNSQVIVSHGGWPVSMTMTAH